MCKYCEKLENEQHEALLENDLFVVQVDTDTPIGRRRDQGSTLRIFDNIDETAINIFYCPMCGRKLNVSESSKSKYIIADNFLDLVPGGDKGKIMKRMYPKEKFDTPQDFLRRVDFNCDWEILESFINSSLMGNV